MAPKKKGKKGYGSSGRGVTTVSTPSKARVNDDSESKKSDVPISSVLDKDETKSDVPESSEISAKAPQHSSELTPDQFEQQLREDENRLLVEKHGDLVRKEASRQATRFKTDRRVLRGQAEAINPRYWISDDLLSTIWDQIGTDLREQQHSASTSTCDPNLTVIRDDDLVRLWQLKKTLLNLDFYEDDIELGLTSLAQAYRADREHHPKRSANNVSELQHCLTWLGLNCPLDRLPDYFTYQNALKNRLREEAEEIQVQAIREEVDIPAAIEKKEEHLTDDVDSGTPEDQTESSEDECDPDNPEHLIKRYLRLMVRLHRLRPELTVVKDGKQKNKRQPQPQVSLPTESSKVKKLQYHLRQLESDLLFDIDDARLRWVSQRQSIEIDSAARQKRKATKKEHDLPSSMNGKLTVARGKSDIDEDDKFLGVGDLMASLSDEDPSSGADTKIRRPSIDTKHSEEFVKDFGKWTGLSPRRILEEVCKARDGNVKIKFRLINENYTKRHSVEVHWSSPQDIEPDCPTKLVSVISSRSFVRFSMMGISTPDALQSEAYISTLALFGLFSSSVKEEKSYLRLPSVWRNLYSELRESSRAMQLETDAVEVDVVRTLMESRAPTPQNDLSLRSDSRTNFVSSGGKEAQNDQIVRPSPNSDIETLRQIWVSKSASEAFRKMERARMMLPMWSFKSQLLSAIENSQVVIVCGETGCGKSTQTPSFILEHELSLGRDCRIYCTEPRRISAISLARRVSEELGEGRSDLGTTKSLVGYSIRLESKISSETRLIYATTGVVMRLLERDADLTEVTHLILDEVHERTIDSDFLLIILRRLIVRRPQLKVVLMSATVNAERFSQYLNGAPIFNVPGRTFPVSVNFLEDAIEAVGARDVGSEANSGAGTSGLDDFSEVEEDGNIDHGTGPMAADDLSGYSVTTRNILKEYNEYRINYDLIVKLLDAIYTKREYEEYSKATLVFLPGINEIRRLNDMLGGHAIFSRRCQVFSLHSTIAMEEQERAFRVPPPGVRKIVLATNIAETGITIPDITCVIDSGTHKEMRFDERRQLSRLIEAFISRANAKQRRGRAGRVQNGLCFHLFTRARHDRLMAEQQTPEIMRLSLQDLVLRIKVCHLGDIEKTLLEALDAPLARNVRRAIDYLIDVKALTQSEQLTLLGRQLAKLPLDVFLGKLILLGSIFKCLDSCLSFAAILSSKSPFAAPMAARTLADHARISFKKGDSDLLTVHNAYSSWRRVCKSQDASEADFCRRNYLSSQTLANIEEIKGQLAGALVDAGFLGRDDKLLASLNRIKSHSRQRHFVELPSQTTLNDSREAVINSVIAWAFYPKLMQREGKGWRNVTSNQSIALHPSSVNKRDFTGRFLSFYHLMQSASKAYNAHETSAVDDFAIALACGEADFQLYAGVVSLDSNRIRFAMPSWKSMLALKYLRSNTLEILEDIYKKPGRQLSDRQQRWFELLQKCFENRCDAN